LFAYEQQLAVLGSDLLAPLRYHVKNDVFFVNMRTIFGGLEKKNFLCSRKLTATQK